MKLRNTRGIDIVKRLGRITRVIILTVVTWPPIHNIMVVTSPMGDHAPPALAASTIMAAKNHLVCLSETSFLSNATITIVVVRLSSAADIKKVRKLRIHKSFTFRVVLILSVMILNPSCLSITSTMVIAPRRKKRISEMSPRC